MNEQVYNEIRNRKERLKKSIEEVIQEGGTRDKDTLELMLSMIDNCKININDRFKGVIYNEKE